MSRYQIVRDVTEDSYLATLKATRKRYTSLSACTKRRLRLWMIISTVDRWVTGRDQPIHQVLERLVAPLKDAKEVRTVRQIFLQFVAFNLYALTDHLPLPGKTLALEIELAQE